jgi:hypothetical protein
MSLKSKIMYTKAMPSHLKKPFSHFLITACILIGGYSATGAEDSAPKTQGKLAFTNLEKEVVLEIGETNKATAFEFTNQGEKPIRIVGIKSSCGCTVPAMEKKEFAPGEVGALNVNFKASSGVQNPSATVLLVSDEEENNFYTLKVVVSRKHSARLSSQREEWKIGSAPETREILVKITEEGTHIVEASSNNDAFDVKMTTIEPGKEYKVTVKPRTCEYPAAASLRLQTTNEKQPFLTARLEIK